MIDRRNLGFFLCFLSIFPLVCFSATFVPVDNYLIDCGASANTTVGRRNFTADSLFKDLLSTQEDILANSSSKLSTSSSDDWPLYQTARIFNGPSKYTFSIKQKGRHWIRLYFFPFTHEKYNLGAANFTVATQDHVLFSSSSMQKDPVMKEYSVNVTSDNLVITFAPSGNSTAFVNAIEVVSAPDDLIDDVFSVLDQSFTLSGLVTQSLETVWRVNMGGPTVTPVNDTLQRTWIPDQRFLLEPNLAKSFSNIAAVKYEKGGLTTENTAPATVYGTLSEMNSSFDPRSNFNVTWKFDVSPGFQYLVRFHFCDVVSMVGVGCMVNSCRSCKSCDEDLENYCSKTIQTYGAKDIDGSFTQGGYSDLVVVDEHFVISIPDNLPLEAAGPLLCAGITVYSPLRYFGIDKPGQHLGVVGLGGLGHMAVKFAKAFGAKVTVISTSPNKKKEAIEHLGADSFLVSRNQEELEAAKGTLDGIIDTVSAVHSLVPLVDLLKTGGKHVIVGLPDKPLELPIFPLLARKSVAASNIGGIKETQEMINYCAKHDIQPDIEIIPVDYVNTAMQRLVKADVKYRFVIDIGNTLKRSS